MSHAIGVNHASKTRRLSLPRRYRDNCFLTELATEIDMEKFVLVSVEKMRQMFNDGDYWNRAKRGEFLTSTKKSHHPSPALAGAPFCTKSEYVVYRDKIFGDRIAEVHQYLKPDNTLAASGKPDPKRLLHDGVLYRIGQYE
jgi:hypothetical protein